MASLPHTHTVRKPTKHPLPPPPSSLHRLIPPQTYLVGRGYYGKVGGGGGGGGRWIGKV